MKKKIYFFASFGDFRNIPAGGGQTAARRLLTLLRKQGYEVSTFNRHRYYFENRIIDRLSLVLFVVIDPILFFFNLLSKSNKDTITLYMGYTGSILVFDYLITKVMNLLNFHCIMYLAGGKALQAYQKGSSRYKRMFERMMKMYDEVMTEGWENIQLVNSVSSKTRTFYLPNYTEDNFAPDTFPDKPNDVINLIYFGRIAPTKNVLLIIDIFEILCEQYKNLTLTIAGSGPSWYVKKVDSKIVASNYHDKIIRYDRIDHNKLVDVIKDRHFYIFPSNEPCEGHSNALNEAMSWGLIPVVSDNNFLPSIVGDESLVAHEFEPEPFVDIIVSLIENRELLEEKSKQIYKRVKENYTQIVVESRLNEELSNFFEEIR